MKRTGWLTAAAGLAFASPGYAQTLNLSDVALLASPDDDQAPDVRQRMEAEFEPIGARFGEVFVYPVATLEAGVSSNSLATEVAPRSDVWLNAQAGVRVVATSITSRLAFNASIGQVLNARLSSEDRTRFLTHFYYRGGSKDRSHWEFTLDGGHVATDRSSVNDVKSARSPIQFNHGTAQASYTHKLSRLSIAGTAVLGRFDYKDARDRAGLLIDQNYRDYSRYGARVEGRYDMGSDVQFIGRVGIDHLNYDFGRSSANFNPLTGFDRDSNTWRVEAGIGLALTDQLYGDATIGYARRTFKAQTNRPKSSGGPSFAANIVWLPSPSTSVRLSADRSFRESASPFFAGYRTVGATIKASHSPMRALILSGEASVHHLNPLGLSFNRTEYAFAGEAEYHLNRRYRLFAKAEHGRRDSGLALEDYRETQFKVGITLTL
jgi:hypothetical protein